MLIQRCSRLLLLAALIATTAWAQPTRVACGPAQAGCGPAIVTTVGGGTTTTLAGVAAPSWVPSMLAAWMLDETSGTRTNLQGTTSRNLSEANGTVGNTTTNKIEGAAAASFAAGQYFTTADTTLRALVPPLTCFAWGRYTGTVSGSWPALIRSGVGNTNGVKLGYDVNNKSFFASAVASVNAPANSTPTNAFGHAALTMVGTTLSIYVNGTLAGTGTSSFSASSFFEVGSTLGESGGTQTGYAGQIDEAGCTNAALSAASICRICSCGIRGEQCTCSGTAFATTGRNASACGSCALPADCSAAAPS